MKCRLCLQERELIKTSHIIPNFMYKGIIDKNKKILEVNLNDFKDAKQRSTGIYDQNILCKECDNVVIGELESYAARNFYNNKNPKLDIEEDQQIINLMFKDIDYTRFKLFLLSILWRASISKQDLFSKVDLGSSYEEVIRKMLLYKQPGKKDDFPICIVGIISKTKLPLKMLSSPIKLKANGNTSYLFFINKFFYWFNISPLNMADVFNKITIDENNQMTIGILKNELGNDFFDTFNGRRLRLRS